MARDTTPGRPGGSPERPARFFAGPEEFDAWLAAHHDTETELWMGLYKKHVPERGLTWAEAVPEALCWGWIDSVAQRIDEDSTRQRWTPRRRTSIWSKVNIDLVEQLPDLALELGLFGAERLERHRAHIVDMGDDEHRRHHGDEELAGIALGRTGKAEEVANVAIFLASQQSSYVTGDRIMCAGGKYM